MIDQYQGINENNSIKGPWEKINHPKMPEFKEIQMESPQAESPKKAEQEEDAKDWMLIEEKEEEVKKEFPHVQLKELGPVIDKKQEDEAEFDSLKGEMPVPQLRGRTLSDAMFGKNNSFQRRKYVQPIATVFFRFSHRNKKNQLLTN